MVGIAAGVGMNLGTHADSAIAGAVAAFFALLGVILGHVLITVYVSWPQHMLAKALANPNSIESQRVILIEHRTSENLENTKVKYLTGPTEEQQATARDQAKEQVAALSDAQVRSELDKMAMQEKRQSLISYRTSEVLQEQRLDSPTMRQVGMANGAAKAEVAKMSDEEVKAELQRRQAKFAAELAAAEAAAEEEEDEEESAQTASGGGTAVASADAADDEDEGSGIGDVRFIDPIGVFIILLAMGTAFKIGGWGFAFGA